MIVIPTRRGTHLQNEDRTVDSHIRIEEYEIGINIYVDLFVSNVSDAKKAHITSEYFPWTDEGANEVTKLLQKNGFRASVMIK